MSQAGFLVASISQCELKKSHPISKREISGTIMKKPLLTVSLIGFAVGAFAQGMINLDNLENTDNSPRATSNGKFFFDTGSGPYLANEDFNISFYGGSDLQSLVLLR